MADNPQVQPASAFIKPVTNPNLVNQPAPQAPEVKASAPQPAPAPVQQPPVAQPQPTPPPAQPQVAQAQPQQVPPAPNYQQNMWDAYAAQQRLMELERINREQQNHLQQLQARSAEQNTTIDNLLKVQQEYEQLKAVQDSNNFDYSGLTTVAPEDAKAITNNIMSAIQTQLEPLKKRIGDQDRQMQATATYQEQRFQQQQAANTLNKILEKHPDFLALRNNPNYVNFLNQRDGLSSYSIDQRAAIEFQLGNADYINHMLDQFKSQQPSVNSINSVAPVQTSSQVTPQAAPMEQLPTLRELNSMMQMRQITPDRYRELLKQIRNTGV